MLFLYNFRKDLENLINNSNLPIDAAYYVLKDVIVEVEGLYKQEIEKEAAIATSQLEDNAVAAQQEENKTE